MADVVQKSNGTYSAKPQESSTAAAETQQATEENSTAPNDSKGQPKEKPDGSAEKKGPAGGHDSSPVSKMPPGYDVRFTFHRATSLPIADVNTLSSDPYLTAQLYTGLPPRHKEDPPLMFRTRAIQRNTDPVWDQTWLVAHVPESGFKLKIRLYDEDPADHDDRLGNVHLHLNNLKASTTPIHEQPFKLKKRMGSKRAYLIRGCAALFIRHVEMSGRLIVSVEVLNKSKESGGRAYTIGPQYWSRHYSPMLGRITGTQDGKSSGKAKQYK
jgi:hypothetical protein